MILAFKKLRWSEQDVDELTTCYSNYPLALSDNLIEKHGKTGCYTKATKLGLGHKLGKGFVDFSSWPETQKAYLAGIIDGEGTITVTKNKRVSKKNGKTYFYYRPVITIANTDYKLLSFLKSLNLGSTNYDRRQGKEHWKQAFQWCLASIKPIYSLLKEIHPYLIIKKDKAEYLMAWIEEHKEF